MARDKTVKSLMMGYEPVQWVTGEIITADKLNHTENGLVELYNELAQNYTKADGTYPEMSVGYANQLLSKLILSNKTPYLFRPSAGGLEIGDREFPTIVGGSVVWNQLIETVHDTQTKNGVTATKDGNKVTFTGTATDLAGFEMNQSSQALTYQQDHVYYSPSGNNVKMYDGYAGDGQTIYKFNRTSSTGYVYALIQNGVTVNETITPMLFDLTMLLGSTIADYIYTLETSTAGAGVAKLKSWGFFTQDYYEYNARSLKSVEGLESHNTVGLNQWDEEWETGIISVSSGATIDGNGIRAKSYNPCIGNTYYYLLVASNIYIFWYDSSKNYINYNYRESSGTVLSPANACYFKIRIDGISTYNNDICINLHWDGERDGEYEPYVKHSYPLDHSLTLRGFLKLDASYNLYYDGDIYEANGTVTRRYGERAYESGDESLPDVITDGTTTIYKLETPTTETADYYTSPQTVSNWGTEEFVTTMDVPIPVGHETEYIIDLKAKLESAPDNPDSDGYYLMRRYQGENSYVEHVNELPTEPTTDGSYTLKSTVTSGESVLSWEPDVP